MKSLVPSLKLALFLLISILFIYGIIEAKNLLFPITFGVLFAYLLLPVASFLELNGIPRILANLMVILLALIVLGLIFFLFYQQLALMFENLDSLKESANKNIESFQNRIQSYFGLSDNRFEEYLKAEVNRFFSSGSSGIGQVFSATTGTVFRMLILPVYIFLFLYYRTKFAYFILKMVKKKNKPVAIRIMRDISTVAGRYMGGVFIVVLILCIINSTGLLIIGVNYAILLGIISAFFNFIPYFGTVMGGAVPLLFVLLTDPDPLNTGLKVLVMFIIVQFTENNILTPNIVGGNVNINPFFIIIGLVVGSMVWGIPGMLVIVPFLAIARIIFINIESLNHYAFLLGPRGTQKHSINFKKIKNKLIRRKK
ncbi:MAG: AI-2E family transporter [Bacteroidales bacterium]